MDLKHEVAYRGVLPVKAEPGVSHNGHPANGHVRDWMAGGAGAGSPSPGPPVQPQPNGYSSPLSSGSYGPYSPNGKIGKDFTEGFHSESAKRKSDAIHDFSSTEHNACNVTTKINTHNELPHLITKIQSSQ
ncbi:hypothetical protein B5X24_HaOG205094 [Helicoverpa armigera]|nr:hypothetical protein B5X24_HaOG205094 [Helicoverpa armigera]